MDGKHRFMGEFCNYRQVYDAFTSENISAEFVRSQEQCYLEHAGATLYSERQIKDIAEDLQKNLYGNPHSLSSSSKLSEDSIDQIRYKVLDHFNTSVEDYSIIFTAGATNALKIVGETFDYRAECSPERTSDECGYFMYLQDNHTSVLGMREYADNFQMVSPVILQNVLSMEAPLKDPSIDPKQPVTNSLFVYPAQCNLSGTKYPLSWIEDIQNGKLNNLIMNKEATVANKWFCMLDAASYVSTNPLDLSRVHPDFVCISFYKLFGYPTGLGALLVKNSSADVLRKKYFGGGTVQISMSSRKMHVFRKNIHEQFEDGTLPFLSILSLRHGFNTLRRLHLNMEMISQHVFYLAQYVHHSLLSLHHANGSPAVKLYCDSNFEDISSQGGIVNFNILRENGEFVGYAEVLHMSNLHDIHIRTGCFCNPGACQRLLGLTDDEIQKHYQAGHICGDQQDLVDGIATGSVRISFGYMSTKKDADTFLNMITKSFVKFPIIKHIDEILSEKLKINNSEAVLDRNELELMHIFIYPIKSCGAFAITHKWEFVNTGLRYDREWMIVNMSGVCLTQKIDPTMCMIKPIINLFSNTLTLTYPGLSPISVPLEYSEEYIKSATICQSKICRDKVQGHDCGDDVMQWLEDALGRPGLRLLQTTHGRIPTAKNRTHKEPVQLSLANEGQFLLINIQSIKWLASLLIDTDVELNLDNLMGRFRANFVVRSNSAFEEHSWSHLKIGNGVFTCEGPCSRCQMICIDQETGMKCIEPLRSLAANSQGKLKFGVYLKRIINEHVLKISPGEKVLYF